MALRIVSGAERSSACGVSVWGETRNVWGGIFKVSVTQGRFLWGHESTFWGVRGSHRLNNVLISLWAVGGIPEEVLGGSPLCPSPCVGF